MWHPVDQNTDNPCPCCGLTWKEIRGPKVTGSTIEKVMAHYGKAFGDPAKKLAVKIANLELGGTVRENSYTNDNMQRGHDEEIIAINKYSGLMFTDVSKGGFYDNGRTGVSPDGNVIDGVVEVKSHDEGAHYEVLKSVNKGLVFPESKYKWQNVFEIRESGKKFVDFISYCSTFRDEGKMIIKRIHLHDIEKELEMVSIRLDQFFKLVDDIKMDISSGKYFFI